jgi:two-component system response regulator HydG
MSAKVLVIDDDRAMCETLEAVLTGHGNSVSWRTRADEAQALLASEDFDVVITDIQLGDSNGLDLCRHIGENRPNTPVIVITAFGDMKSAVAALRAGAYDFRTKPVDMTALAHGVDRAVQHRHLREEVVRLKEAAGTDRAVGHLVGESPAMKRVYDLISRVANTSASVLITGESGTGKELIARALHSESDRRDKPFVAINCAAVPANLLESELFGHVKGAFTDAHSGRRGLFEQASGGTIFLDEIGEMPTDMQPKLLRVLQERKVRPVGGNTEIAFDTRVIAATNRDLETQVDAGTFREDLYYRLNVVQIHSPPLRARGNDLLTLAQHFVERVAARTGKPVRGLSSDAARKLLEYDWPGNVRQLENSIERAVTLTRFEQITTDDLPEKIRDHQPSKLVLVDYDAEHLLSLDELERRYIERVLKTVSDNKTRAAKLLGLDRRTLYRKLERYGNRDSESANGRTRSDRPSDHSQLTHESS